MALEAGLIHLQIAIKSIINEHTDIPHYITLIQCLYIPTQAISQATGVDLVFLVGPIFCIP